MNYIEQFMKDNNLEIDKFFKAKKKMTPTLGATKVYFRGDYTLMDEFCKSRSTVLNHLLTGIWEVAK